MVRHRDTIEETVLLKRSLRRERKLRKPKMKISGRRVKALARLIREKSRHPK